MTRLTNVNADLKKQASSGPPGFFQPVVSKKKAGSPPGLTNGTARPKNEGLLRDEINLLKAQLDSALQDIDLKSKQLKIFKENEALEEQTRRKELTKYIFFKKYKHSYCISFIYELILPDDI